MPAARTPLQGRLVARPATPIRPARPAVPVAPAPAPVAPAAPAPVAFDEPRGFSRFSAVGGLAFLLALAVLILNFVLPWIYQPNPDQAVFENQSSLVERDELSPFLRDDYGRDLLTWPVIGTVVTMIAGLALVALDFLPLPPRPRNGARVAVLVVAAYFAFLLALAGMRWLGSYVIHLWGDGDARFHLHAVPYLNLALGLGFLASELLLLAAALAPFLRDAPRGRLPGMARVAPAATVTVAALALLLLPLFPFAEVDGSYFDESDLDSLQDDEREKVKAPGRDLQWIRWMLWAAIWIATVAGLAAIAERAGHLPELWGVVARLEYLVVVPILVGAVFTVLLYVDLPQLGEGLSVQNRFVNVRVDVDLAYNYVPILAFLALAGLVAFYAFRLLGARPSVFGTPSFPGG